MRLLLTKLHRSLLRDKLPTTCYAYQWIPESLNMACDCKTFCKFPPKKNQHIIPAYEKNSQKKNLLRSLAV